VLQTLATLGPQHGSSALMIQAHGQAAASEARRAETSARLDSIA
jgi:hypothetical protein